ELGAAEPWTLHATGRILREAGSALLVDAPVQAPDRPADFTADAHFQLTHAVGLDYGPAFRALKHGWKEGDGTVIALLEPAAVLHDGLAQTRLHPALLDNAFQLVVPLLFDDPSADRDIAFVPAKIGRLAIRDDRSIPSWVRATLRRRSPHSLTIDFALFNQAGEQVAAVRDARFRSIRLSKASTRVLDFLADDGTPAPHAHDPASHQSTLDTSALTGALASATAAAVQDGVHARYAHEIEPLLDSLCDRFLVQAIRDWAPDSGHLYDDVVDRCRQAMPDAALLLDHLLDRATRAGLLKRMPSGWTCAAEDDETAPGAIDIWNSLVREYPDYAHIVHAAGRVGLHLAELLRGRSIAADSVSMQSTPGALLRQILGAEARQRIGAALRSELARAQAALPAGRRLSVLEISAHAPAFAIDCCSALDFALADYRYSSTTADAIEQAQRQLDLYPDASTVLIGQDGDDTAQADHDLVILH